MADPVESLGPFPILQTVVAAVIAIGFSVAVWFGLLARKGRGNPDSSNQTQIDTLKVMERIERSLDGARVENAAAAAAAGDLLKGCYRVLGEIRTENGKYADERNLKNDMEADILRRIERNTDIVRPIRAR